MGLFDWFFSGGQQTFQNIITPVAPQTGTIGAAVATAQQATRPQTATQQSVAPAPTLSVPLPEQIRLMTTQEAVSPFSGISSFLKDSAENVSSQLSGILRPIIETPQVQAAIKAVTSTAAPAQTPQTVSDMSQFSRDIYGGASRIAAVIGTGMGIADIGARRIERQLPGGLSELYGATYELGKGIFLSAPRLTVDMAGMIPGGVETIAKNIPMLPAFAAAGVISQVSGLQEGFSQRPIQTIGELIGMGAMGEAGKVVRFGQVKIPTAAGEVPVWKGAYLDIGATPRPIVGYVPEFIAKPITEPIAIGFRPETSITKAVETARTAKTVFGTPSSLEIPQITDITAGYFPRSALETAIVARPEILTKLGMEPTAATKISVGRELIGLTSGQKTAFQLTRPYSFEIFGKEIVTPFKVPTLIAETESLSSAGVSTTLQYLKTEKFKLTDVPKVGELTALERLTEINKEILKAKTPLEGDYSFKSTMELETSPGKKVSYYDILESGKTIGTTLIEASGKDVKIGTFELSPEFRGKGIGTGLAEKILKEFELSGMEKVSLIPKDVRAANFWQKIGFEYSREVTGTMELKLQGRTKLPEYSIEDLLTISRPVFERMGIDLSRGKLIEEIRYAAPGEIPKGISDQTRISEVSIQRAAFSKTETPLTYEILLQKGEPLKQTIETLAHEISHAVLEKGFEESSFVAEPTAIKGSGIFLSEFSKYYAAAKIKPQAGFGLINLIQKEYAPYVVGKYTSEIPYRPAIKSEYRTQYPTEVKPLIEKVMGSFSAQAQMMPEFRRVAGDIDIHTRGTTEQAVQLATGLQAKLAEIGIESRVSGSTVETRGISKEWVHAVQFLPKEELSYIGTEGAGLRYGIKVEQPPMTVEGMPVMKLGEQATRKITGSLEFREGKLQPAEHRLLKDVRDAYTTAFTLIESKSAKIGIPILKDIEVARGRQLLQQWKELYPEIDWIKVGQEPIKMEIQIEGISKGTKKASLTSEINKYAERISEQKPYTFSAISEAANVPYVPSTYEKTASVYTREFTPFTEEIYPIQAKPEKYSPALIYGVDYPIIKEPSYRFPFTEVPTYKTTEYPPDKVPSYIPTVYPPTDIPKYPTPYTPEKVPPYVPTVYTPELYPPEVYPPETYPPYGGIGTPFDPIKIIKPLKDEVFIGKRKKTIKRKSVAYTIKNPLADLEDVLGIMDADIRKEINPTKKKRKSK